MIYMHFGINGCVFMEIKSDSQGIEDIIKEYGGIEKRLNAVKEDFVNIIIDVDDYWEGRSGDSFKYICWYLKLLLDNGIEDFKKMEEKIKIAKDLLLSNDSTLSKQIEEHK